MEIGKWIDRKMKIEEMKMGKGSRWKSVPERLMQNVLFAILLTMPIITYLKNRPLVELFLRRLFLFSFPLQLG